MGRRFSFPSDGALPHHRRETQMLTLIFIVNWVLFAIIVGLFARNYRNRSMFDWVLASIFLSPLFSFLLVAVLKRKEKCPSVGAELMRVCALVVIVMFIIAVKTHS
jgi:cytochrome bd-type quinol oxidase subunit 2